MNECEHKQLKLIYAPGMFGQIEALQCVECKKKWTRNTYFVAEETKKTK